MFAMKKISLAIAAVIALCGVAASQPFGLIGPGPQAGFPITLGSTVINSGSITTSVTGLSIASGSSNTLAGLSFTADAAGTIAWSGRTKLLSGADGTLNFQNNGGTISSFMSWPVSASHQFGASDVDTGPVAQIIRSQGALAGGTSNVAGANWTFIASPGKGTGAGGSLIFQTAPAGLTGSTVNAPVTALTIDSTQTAIFSNGITASGSGFVLKTTVGQAIVWSGGSYGFASGGAVSQSSTADAVFTRGGTASIQMGLGDVDTGPVAQIFRSQGTLAGGTSNVAGANWTFIASPGKGTGIGGSFIFQTTPAGSTGTVVGTPTTALTLDSTQKATFAGQINVTAMTQSSAAQSGTVCYNSGTGAVNYDATLGCLTSLEELKDIRSGGISGALPEIMKLRPFWYSWKHNTPEWNGGNHETLPGLGAHATEAVDKRLVGYGPTGKLAGVHYTEMVALLVAGLQEEHRDNLALRAANDNLERRIAKLERRR